MTQSEDRLSAEIAGQLPKHIVIVGNTESAWMAAALLGRWAARLNIRVTVISSGTPCAEFPGETSQPSLAGFAGNLRVDEHMLMRGARATYQLATQFSDWVQQDRDFWVPLNNHEVSAGGISLFDSWFVERSRGQMLRPLQSCSLHWAAALAGKAPHGFSGSSPLARTGSYGFQLDGDSFAQWLREIAIADNVRELSGRPDRIVPNLRGGISQINLTTGEEIVGDLFLDCTGRDSLLIAGAQKRPFVSYDDRLLCDRFVSVQVAGRRQIAPFTQITGVPSGWTCRIPLANSISVGMAYRSSHLDDEAAWSELCRLQIASAPARATVQAGDNQAASAGVLAAPVFSSIEPRRQSGFWHGNVVALGTAACSLDPIVSAGRHLTQLGIELLMELFPEQSPDAASVTQYNQRMVLAADEFADFAQLHYVLSRRIDSDFWTAASQTVPPSGLRQRLALFKTAGSVGQLAPEAVPETRYQHLFAGSGVLPTHPVLQVTSADPAGIQHSIREILKANEMALKDLPLHEELLDWIHSLPAQQTKSA